MHCHQLKHQRHVNNMANKLLSSLLLGIFVVAQVNAKLELIGAAGGFEFYLDSNTNRNWNSAKSHCSSNGMYIATLDQSQKNLLVANYMQANLGKNARVWTGGQYNLPEKFWFWETSGNRFSYQHWHPSLGSPVVPGTKQTCVAMDGGSEWYWKPTECGETMHVLCQG